MHKGNASYRHAHNDLWALQTLPLINQHALETQEVNFQTAQILHQSLFHSVCSNSVIFSRLGLGIYPTWGLQAPVFLFWKMAGWLLICVLRFT